MKLTERLSNAGIILSGAVLGYAACSWAESSFLDKSFSEMLKEPLTNIKIGFYFVYVGFHYQNIVHLFKGSREDNLIRNP